MPRASAVEEIVRRASIRGDPVIIISCARSAHVRCFGLDGPKIAADGTKAQIANLRNIRVDDGDKNGPRSAALADRSPIILLIWVFGGLH
jgi:hypothetical protein